MATTGKLPLLGFKAAAIKFVTLFGFSPNKDTSGYRPIAMTGSVPETPALTGSVPQQALTGVYQDG